MSDFVTDTHALIWYLQDSPRLGKVAQAAFDACDSGRVVVYIPSICLVEIIYLQEWKQSGRASCLAPTAAKHPTQ